MQKRIALSSLSPNERKQRDTAYDPNSRMGAPESVYSPQCVIHIKREVGACRGCSKVKALVNYYCPLCRANGIGQIVWSPLAQGALTGKYRPGEPPPSGSRATSARMGRLMDRWLDDDVLRRVQLLLLVAARLGITPAQLALAWVLRDDDVACAIVGASGPGQVHENTAASGVVLDEATLAEIDGILE